MMVKPNFTLLPDMNCEPEGETLELDEQGGSNSS